MHTIVFILIQLAITWPSSTLTTSWLTDGCEAHNFTEKIPSVHGNISNSKQVKDSGTLSQLLETVIKWTYKNNINQHMQEQ